MKINKKTAVVILVLAIVILISSLILSLKGIFKKEDERLIDLANKNAINTNILIMKVIKESDRHNVITSYAPILSGVVFEKEENSDKYYALTAFHGIELSDNSEYIIAEHNRYLLGDSSKTIDMNSYYNTFPKATIEYYDEGCDLAVLSFTSESELSKLSISKANPEYNQPIIAMGNPQDKNRNLITTGEVTTKSPVSFETDKKEITAKVFEHSAKTYPGSSGGAILNEQMEIVGIHIGVGDNIFGSFIRGMAIPAEKINEFLEENQDKIKG